MNIPRPWRELLLPVALAIAFPAYFVGREYAVGGTFGFPLDDSWIHLVFARSLARGDFFAYNPHAPVAGSTSPLWTVLLGLGYLLWSNPVLMPKVIGIVLHVVLCAVIADLARTVGASRLMAIATAAIVACTPRLVWAAVSGMEVTLYCTLGVLAIDLYLRHRTEPGVRQYSGWAVSGVGVWARPELLVLPVFFLLHELLMRTQHRGEKGKARPRTAQVTGSRPLRGLGVALLVSLPFFLLNEALSGTLLPLTFYAKTARAGIGGLLDNGDVGEIARRTVESLFVMNANTWKWIWVQDNIVTALIGIGAAGAMLWVLVRRRARLEDVGLVLLFLVLALFGPVRSVVTGALDYMQYGRYGAIVSPLMIVFAAVWFERRLAGSAATRSLPVIVFAVGEGLVTLAYYGLVPRWGRGHQMPSFDWYLPMLDQGTVLDVVMVVALGLVIGVVITVLMRRRVRMPLSVAGLWVAFAFTVVESWQTSTEYAWNVRNINDTQVALGQWLARYAPPGTAYATTDIGAMAYFADSLRIVDLMGLVRADVGEKLRETGSSDATALWVMQTRHPAYLVCFNEWFPALVRDGVRAQVLRRVYSVSILNNLTCGGPGVTAMHVYAIDYAQMPALLALASGGRTR